MSERTYRLLHDPSGRALSSGATSPRGESPLEIRTPVQSSIKAETRVEKVTRAGSPSDAVLNMRVSATDNQDTFAAPRYVLL